MSSSDPRDPRDPNPFVAFRRYADAQFASMFNSVADPFRHPSHENDEFRKAQEDLWRRFERSYERATSPTRTQTDRDGSQPARHEGVKDVLPGFGREIEDPLQDADGPYSPIAIKNRENTKRNQGVFGRMLSALGKTDVEEESSRLAGALWKDVASDEQQRAEEIGRRMDRCPGVQAMYAEQDRADEEARAEYIGKSMDRCPAVQAMYVEHDQAEEQARAEEISRRMEKCPGMQQMQAEQDAAAEFQRRFPGYSLAWSWGPWGYEMGTPPFGPEASAKREGEKDIRVEEHTFGPWSVGPMHIGPMSMVASFPNDMQGEFHKMAEEVDKQRQAAMSRVSSAIQHTKPHPSPLELDDDEHDTTDDDLENYAPAQLMKMEGLRGHVNWRQAYEDLVAAELGEEMLGGTPWETTEHESDESWHAHLAERGLLQKWSQQRELERAHLEQQQVQRSQDAPHLELEFYDRLEPQPQSRHEDDKPNVLSTVTTVETAQNPDGSTSTKRTTKRRFSDGRLEKEESNEETPARGASLWAERSEKAPKPILEQARGEETPISSMAETLKVQKKKEGSWFWS